MDRHGLLDQTFSRLRSGVLAVDCRREILLLNPAAGAILEIEPTQAEGQPFDDALQRHPHLVAFLIDALNSDTGLDRTELCLHGSKPTTLGVTTTPLPETPTSERGLVVVFKDLPQIERQEEQEQLKERLSALGEMAAGLAHEMRNPLAGIKVAVGLLRKMYPEMPELETKLRSIMGDVQQLNQSITNCLAFARPLRVEPRYIHVNEVIDKVLDQIVSLEHTHPFRVVRRLDPDLPRTWVDPQQLEIVFFNLINNAIDAVRLRNGTITISTALGRAARGNRDELIATIADDGEGIHPDRLPKVFIPFFTTKQKGSGLGLANAKKIINHLRGTIEVTSEQGAGASFSVHLPVLSAPAHQAPAA